MKIALTVVKGPELGHVLEFHEPRGFIIGRGADADLQLGPDDPYVSRRHVYLEICPPSCRLRNLGIIGRGATNPPHVNGQPVLEDRELAQGDVIELGYTQLKVAIAAEGALERAICAGCGVPMMVLAGEAASVQCDRCVERGRAEADAAPGVQASCCGCGAALTDRANGDGRAGELASVALYACERCAGREGNLQGERVGPYQLLRLLGEGGMGIVHLAYQPDTARLVAMKRMKDLKDPLRVKRFQREVRLMKELEHPNVVRCIDVGVDTAGFPYLVSEYVRGIDLGAVAQAGPLDSLETRRDAIRRIIEVLCGLEYLHGRRIMHRDIKPQNILLLHPPEAGGSTYAAKIADFGIAVSYARAGGTRLTTPGMWLGTLMYMSPEQVRDPGTVREPADLYSLGVTLYYLLTGQYTFDFPSPGDVAAFQQQRPDLWKRPEDALRALMQLRRILHPFEIILGEEPIPIRQRVRSIPATLAAVVDRAVKKDSRERFQTAREFRTALEGAMS